LLSYLVFLRLLAVSEHSNNVLSECQALFHLFSINCIFHSNQSSLRKITYKEKIWDIKNEWFWMSNREMLNLANTHGFSELYHDAQNDHDRFIYNKLQELTFSEDAQEVLDKAIEIVIKTFPYREQLHEEHPEYHLNTWDAGWYQIKKVLNNYMKDELEEFTTLYKKFEDRMREGVYKFGFLK